MSYCGLRRARWLPRRLDITLKESGRRTRNESEPPKASVVSSIVLLGLKRAHPLTRSDGEAANVLCQLASDFIGDYEIVESLAHLSNYQVKPLPILPRILPELRHANRKLSHATCEILDVHGQSVDIFGLPPLGFFQVSYVNGESRLLLNDKLHFAFDIIAHAFLQSHVYIEKAGDSRYPCFAGMWLTVDSPREDSVNHGQ